MHEFNIEMWFEQNMNLVHQVASTSKVYGMESDELFQELMIICWHASEKFDPDKGIKFSTYAVTAMQNRVKELSRNNSTKKRKFETDAESIDNITEDGTPVVEAMQAVNQDYVEDLVAAEEIKSVIQNILSGMNKRDRSIVCEVMAGYNQITVAKRHNVSQPSVCWIYQDFKNNVHKALAEN